MKFETLNLDPRLQEEIRGMRYERCTPVQEQALPESLAGRDVSVRAQTGTGKTAVFLITIIQRMLEVENIENVLGAIILTPTRELAVQIEKQAAQFCRRLPLRTLAIYGGVGYERQIGALRKGVHIAVATPGRLKDLYMSKNIDFSNLKFFAIDEADRMFDMGFMEDVRFLLRKAPPVEKRHTMIFSATLDGRIRRVAAQYMRDPVEIEIEPDQITVENVKQLVYHVSRKEKLPLLLELLRREGTEKTIIFTNMKRTAEEVAFRLNGNGIKAEAITGDLSQMKRLSIIKRIQSGALRILVATDVAARGLHIDDVTHVINYDLPNEVPNYVHRIGRTARAGARGVAYTIACENLVEILPAVERYIEQKIEVGNIDFELPEDKAPRYRRKRPGESRSPSYKDRPPRSGSSRPAPYPRRAEKKSTSAPKYKTSSRPSKTGEPKPAGEKRKWPDKKERPEYRAKKRGGPATKGRPTTARHPSAGKKSAALSAGKGVAKKKKTSKSGIIKKLFGVFKRPTR